MRLELRPPPPPRAKVYTRKRWVRDLLEKRDAVEGAIGMPLGDMLGCGSYGCVFRSQGPWVVKLTVDQTEGPIWAEVVRLIDEEEWGSGGFSRVRKIVRLTPDVGAGRRKRKLYAIVREDCEPILSTWEGRPSRYTWKMLGMPEDMLDEWTISTFHAGMVPGIHRRLVRQYGYEQWEAEHAEERAKEFYDTCEALHRYRDLELDHRPGARRHAWRTYQTPMPRGQLIERLEQITYRMHGRWGEPMGESLRLLLSNGIVMRDLHFGNIGWRVHTEIDEDHEPECLVIYDPGHTPTSHKPEIEQRMIANARWGF
jgi:hypothetical protein